MSQKKYTCGDCPHFHEINPITFGSNGVIERNGKCGWGVGYVTDDNPECPARTSERKLLDVVREATSYIELIAEMAERCKDNEPVLIGSWHIHEAQQILTKIKELEE